MNTNSEQIWLGKENFFFKLKKKLNFIKFFLILSITFFLFSLFLIANFYYNLSPNFILSFIIVKFQFKYPDIINFLNFFNKNNYVYGYFCFSNGECSWSKILLIQSNLKYINNYINYISPILKSSVIFSSIITGIFDIFVIKFFKGKTKEISKDLPLRGRKVVRNINELPKKYRKNYYLPLGENVGVPFEDIFRHIFILGASGSGKTTLINQQIAKLKNKKVIILGYKGDFLAKFYNPEIDIIFNPYDERNIGWRLLNDLKKSNQIYSFAQSIIKETKEPFWSDSATLVFVAICEICLSLNEISNKKLFKYLTMSLPEMYSFLLKLSENIDSAKLACQALGGSDTKHGRSILSTLSTAIKDFKFLNDGDFSFRTWIRDNSCNNWLFIENGPQQDNLSSLYSGIIDIIANEILSLPDCEIGEREIYIVIDEWGTLNKIDSIRKLITLGRSKGCCMILANQDLARISKIYDKDLDTMFNSLGTLISFKIEDNFTQEYLSKTFGKIKFKNIRKSHQLTKENNNSISYMSNLNERNAVLGSEFGSLNKFECFIKFPDGIIFKHKIKEKFFENIIPENEIFIEKSELNIEENHLLKHKLSSYSINQNHLSDD